MTSRQLSPGIPNREVMLRTRAAFRGKWAEAGGYMFFLMLAGIAMGVIFNVFNQIPLVILLTSGVTVIVTSLLKFGLNRMVLSIIRGQEPDMGDSMCFGFRRIGEVFCTWGLFALLCLPSAILLIGGSYLLAKEAMTWRMGGIAAVTGGGVWLLWMFGNFGLMNFILAEDDRYSPRDVLRRSKALMYGHRKQFWLLLLRMTGWVLLGVLSCFIAFLWIFPYLLGGIAQFYESLKPAEEEELPTYPGMNRGWTVLNIAWVFLWGTSSPVSNMYAPAPCTRNISQAATKIALAYQKCENMEDVENCAHWRSPVVPIFWHVTAASSRRWFMRSNR